MLHSARDPALQAVLMSLKCENAWPRTSLQCYFKLMDLICKVVASWPFPVVGCFLPLCSLVHSWRCVQLCSPLDCSTCFTISQSLLRLVSIESVMPSSCLIPCCRLLLLPSIFPSIRVFSSELALHIRWPKYWNFSFSISPSKEYSGLFSFRIDWFDLLVVQGTLKNLLQFHSSLRSSPSLSLVKCLLIIQVWS